MATAGTLIDQYYFKGNTFIPGVENRLISDPLCKYIKKYEPKFLNNSMGNAFAKKFMEQVALAPSNGIWFDLAMGCEFTDCNGNLKTWDGLKDPVLMQSIISNYVYYFFSKDNITQTTSIGEKKAQAENASNASPGYKMSTAWNEMCQQVRIMWQLLTSKTDAGAMLYPDFDMSLVNKCHFGYVTSLGI